jgi:hypothetical protein
MVAGGGPASACSDESMRRENEIFVLGKGFFVCRLVVGWIRAV